MIVERSDRWFRISLALAAVVMRLRCLRVARNERADLALAFRLRQGRSILETGLEVGARWARYGPGL